MRLRRIPTISAGFNPSRDARTQTSIATWIHAQWSAGRRTTRPTARA